MLDARRMEVYDAIYDRSLKVIKEVSADVIDEHSYRDILDKQKVVFFGNGSEKCKSVINHPNAIFVDDIDPLAKYMFPLAEKALAENRTVDVAYFEPFYLKDFVATKPKKLF
jgi:tRNA threonylcarbamoyladenosine biosynthesis protein TsaB